MAVRFFVDSNNVLAFRTENDDLATPADHTVVTEAAIRAAYASGIIYPNGTWDGTAYAPPANQYVADSATTDTGRLRTAVREAHAQLLDWSDMLTTEGIGHPATETMLGHSYVAYGHQAIYLVAHNHRRTGADWTVAQRIAYCQQMALGAADVTSPFTFYMALQGDSGLIVTPTGPVGWVNADTGARVDLSDAITTTNGMRLDVTQLPNESIIAGGWIGELTA